MHWHIGSKFSRIELATAGILFSATMWGLLWYPMRWLSEQGINGAWASLFMYLAATLPGFISSYRARGVIHQYPWRMFWLALSNGWCNLAFVLAVIDGNVVRVLLLFYLYPMWSILVGWVFLHERPARRDLMTLLLALLGAIVILWSPQATNVSWHYTDVMAISAGVSFAIANAIIRSLQSCPLVLMTQVTWLGVCLVASLWLGLSLDPLPEISLMAGLVMLLMGLLGVVTMTLAVQYGIRELPLHRSATLLLFEVLVGAVSAHLWAEEIMSQTEWIGGGIIMLAAYLTMRQMKEGHHDN